MRLCRRLDTVCCGVYIILDRTHGSGYDSLNCIPLNSPERLEGYVGGESLYVVDGIVGLLTVGKEVFF